MPDTGTIACAPFRLASSRSLTPWEWSVITSAMAGAMGEVRADLLTSAEPVKLRLAVQEQPCAAWTTNQFGPAPCVCTLWYEALARWYAGFPDATRAGILTQIRNGSLCSGQTPWVAAATSRYGNYAGKPSTVWEGQLQTVSSPYMPPVVESLCAGIRSRTAYAPVTGRELLSLMKVLASSGQLPQGLEAMANLLPGAFLDRSFLLGIQAKANLDQGAILAALQSPTLMGTGLQLVDDVALLWAPGQGVSLLSGLAQGGLDPQKLLALLATMTPDLLGQVVNNLPSILSQLPTLGNQLPQLQGQLPALFQTSGQLLGAVLGGVPAAVQGLGGVQTAPTGQPGTPPLTGLRMVDVPGVMLKTDPAPPADLLGKLGAPPGAGGKVLAVVGGIVVGLLGVALIRRRKDRRP